MAASIGPLLAGIWWGAAGGRGGQFVAAVDHRDGKGAVDGQVGVTCGDGQRDLGGPQAGAGFEQGMAGGKVHARGADMAPERVWRGPGEGHLIAVASRVFLKQDHVGPGRQGRPGADADGLTRPDRTGERMPGGAFAHDLPRAGHVGLTQGIAVHRRRAVAGWVRSASRGPAR
jgi:hypothetical protein